MSTLELSNCLTQRLGTSESRDNYFSDRKGKEGGQGKEDGEKSEGGWPPPV